VFHFDEFHFDTVYISVNDVSNNQTNKRKGQDAGDGNGGRGIV